MSRLSRLVLGKGKESRFQRDDGNEQDGDARRSSVEGDSGADWRHAATRLDEMLDHMGFLSTRPSLTPGPMHLILVLA